MKKRIERNPALALVLACYAVGLVVFLAACLWSLAQNRLAYANGALRPATLTLADFDLHDLELREDGTLLSVGGDPQLLLKDTGRRVENATLYAAYRLDPLVVNAFWTDGAGAYSPRRMAYGAAVAPDGSVASGGLTPSGARFWLPAAGGLGLRLDPGVKVGNTIALHSVVINEKRPVYRFFLPTAGQAALLAVLPALAACGLWLLGELLPPKLRPNFARTGEKAGDAHG